MWGGTGNVSCNVLKTHINAKDNTRVTQEKRTENKTVT